MAEQIARCGADQQCPQPTVANLLAQSRFGHPDGLPGGTLDFLPISAWLGNTAIQEKLLQDGTRHDAIVASIPSPGLTPSAELDCAVEYFTALAAGYQEELARQRQKAANYAAQLAEQLRENARARQAEQAARDERAYLERQLALVTGSRTWQWRERAVRLSPRKVLPRLMRLRNRHPLEYSTQQSRHGSRPSTTINLATRPCTIVIPVYNAFPETIACLRSVIEHTAGCHNILVVDDCSPAGPFADVVPPECLGESRVRIHRNATNLGFVGTCNWAMQEAGDSDVVLLNSDTLVTPRWLEKLREAAFSHPRIGTVTPLTNRGTICSIPAFLEDNELPAGHTLNEFAALVEAVSAREYPELPTCVGFCVYIKREVIERIGRFDGETFGKGYGEENDFSCRLRAAGFIDVLDDATFVYHHGSKSFLAAGEGLCAEHLKILVQKHPDYLVRVGRFVEVNPLRNVQGRVRDAMLHRWNANAEYTILHILHNPPITGRLIGLPGGIEYHVADLIRTIPRAAHWSLYAADGVYHLTAHVPGAERRYRLSMDRVDLAELIDRDHFDMIHVHQTSTFNLRTLADALLEHGQYFVSIHDFWLVCPAINLLTPDGRLCDGHSCASACHHRQRNVDFLRTTSKQLLQNARAVFHFSDSTKNKFEEILGGDYPWQFIEHGIDLPTAVGQTGGRPSEPLETPAKPSADLPLKVAFVGGPGVHKGMNLIRQIVKHQRLPSGVALEWHRIGPFDDRLVDTVHQHGQYNRELLPAMIDAVGPHLVGILSIWPETYCYTLDEVLACGVPVVCTPLGAPAERVRQHRCGWLIDQLTVEAVLAALQRVVDDWEEYQAVCQRIPTIALRRAGEVAPRYDAMYRRTCEIAEDARATRLESIAKLRDREPSRAAASLRHLAGLVIKAALRTLDMLHLKQSATRFVRGMLSTRLHERLCRLRQQAK